MSMKYVYSKWKKKKKKKDNLYEIEIIELSIFTSKRIFISFDKIRLTIESSIVKIIKRMKLR